MKNLLVTGGRGFIGFNALRLWKKERPEYGYVELDAETYADKVFQEEKDRWLEEAGIPWYVRWLENGADLLDEIIKRHGVDTIVHFAAESHVDNSIENPRLFYQANVVGTVEVLEAARRNGTRVHVVGTDEVYGETTPDSWKSRNGGFVRPEDMPLRPSSPYSASKAAADMAALAWCRTFGVNVTVSRCSNNFGPWQHPEKLIGTIVTKALAGKAVPLYGDGQQKRHWIHVDEHNRAVMDILEHGSIGKIYNVAPPAENWITNMQLVVFILRRLGFDPVETVDFVKDRPGHDASYFLYGTDFCQRKELWEKGMAETVDWYRERISK